MEIFNNLIQTLTTPNEELTNIICSPLIFVEALVSMLLFTTILNIKTTTKQKIYYVVIISILGLINRLLIPAPYGTIINLILCPLLVFFILKGSILSSIVAQFIPSVITVILESIFLKLYLLVFSLSLEDSMTIAIYKIPFILFIYLIIFIIYKICKKFNFNITILDNMNRKNKVLLILNFIMGIIAISIQYYLIQFYNDTVPFYITIISSITLLLYFIISLYSLIKSTKLEMAQQDLEETKLYNKTLTILHDNMRCFKHDFNNILQAIGGYIQINDMEGLKKYYKQILKDCDKVNNLYVLSPDVINNPAIYSILASKYYSADAKGITISLDVFLDLNDLKMQVYEFTRILGILLDNAIEASSECEEKIINITIRNEENKHRQVLIISNTYPNKDVDTEKIYEKAYTTKPNNTGLGLWEVRKILNKNNNLNLFTTKNSEFFTQQLEIYY